LVEADWDIEKATDLVKARGLSNVAARASKVSTEGALVIKEYLKDGWTSKFMLEVNCQTDFVAKGQDFIKFVNLVVKGLKQNLTATNPSKFEEHEEIESLRKDLSNKTGENIVVRRWTSMSPEKSDHFVYSYTHSNNKIGVLLCVRCPMSLITVSDKLAVDNLCNDIAMQIAAMNPLAVTRDDIDPQAVERQKGIFEKQLEDAKKPQASWEKIIAGKFNKWYSETVLLEQESIMVPKKIVNQVVDELSKKVNGPIKVIRFQRFEVGEGLESNKSDLADDVKRMLQGK